MSLSFVCEDYFEEGADPSLRFLCENEQQRKISCDELLPPLTVEVNPTSHVTCASPTPKPQSWGAGKATEKKPKKRRDNTKTLAEGLQRGHWATE